MAKLHLTTRWDKRSFDRAFDHLLKELEQVARGLTVHVWNGVLSKTPQKYGRMVASWQYCVNVPEFVDRSDAVDPDPSGQKLPAWSFNDMGEFKGLWRGHPAAIRVANAANAGKDKSFKLGDVVYLTNGVNHGEGHYALDVEEGRVNLRFINRPGDAAARTLRTANKQFEHGVTPYRAVKFKSMTIGAMQ